MELFIFVAIFSLAIARNVEENCNGVIVHNINHKQEVLKDNLDSPYQLAIDYDTNLLFFSYSTNINDGMFKSAYINLKTNTFKNISGIKSGFANAVDSNQHIVYLGGQDGIYKFNFETEQAEHVTASNYNIWQLFFKDDLYFTTYPKEETYVYKNGIVERVPELANTKTLLVALDNKNNLYFSNLTGLYVHKRTKGYISNLGDYNVNGFTADTNGNLYFSTPSAIYFINDDKEYIEKITNIISIYGIAIEADGSIIYASTTGIIRLTPTKLNCYINEKDDVSIFDNKNDV